MKSISETLKKIAGILLKLSRQVYALQKRFIFVLEQIHSIVKVCSTLDKRINNMQKRLCELERKV